MKLRGKVGSENLRLRERYICIRKPVKPFCKCGAVLGVFIFPILCYFIGLYMLKEFAWVKEALHAENNNKLSMSCNPELSFFKLNRTTGGVLMTFIDRSSKEFGTLIELASLDYWSSIGFIVDKEEQADDLLRFQKMLSTEDSAKVYCKYRNISSILYRQENPLFREWRCPLQLNEILSYQADVDYPTLSTTNVDIQIYTKVGEQKSTSLRSCVAVGALKARLGLCTAPLSDLSYKLAEWFGYHIRLGVEQFLIYEHFNSWKHAQLHNLLINSLLEANLAVKHNFTVGKGAKYQDAHYRYKQKSTHNALMRLQPLAQNHCLYTYRDSFEWLLYIDVDEFVYLPQDNTAGALMHILDSFISDDNFCALKVKNMLYNGEITGDFGSCLVTSKFRTRKLNVVRGKRQKMFARSGINGAATVGVSAPQMCRKLGICNPRGYGSCSEGVLSANSTVLRINHYPLSQGFRMDRWNEKNKKVNHRLLKHDILEGGEDTNAYVIDKSLDDLSYAMERCLKDCKTINISCLTSL